MYVSCDHSDRAAKDWSSYTLVLVSDHWTLMEVSLVHIPDLIVKNLDFLEVLI